MSAIVLRAELSDQAIDLAEHEALVVHRAAGAVVGFVGAKIGRASCRERVCLVV